MKKSLNEELSRIQELLNEFVVFKGDRGDSFLIDIMQLGKQPLVSSRKADFVAAKLRGYGFKNLEQYDIMFLKQLLATVPNIEQAIVNKFTKEFGSIPKESQGSHLESILSKFEPILQPQQISKVRTVLNGGQVQNQGGVGDPNHPNLLQP